MKVLLAGRARGRIRPMLAVMYGCVLAYATVATGAVFAKDTDARTPTQSVDSLLSPFQSADGGAAPYPYAQATVQKAGDALRRSRALRANGDVEGAALLEDLAREWAETARDLVRAAEAEGDAGVVARDAQDAAVRAERQRALLEEAIGRRGRAWAELARMRASEAYNGVAFLPRGGNGAGEGGTQATGGEAGPRANHADTAADGEARGNRQDGGDKAPHRGSMDAGELSEAAMPSKQGSR